MLMILSFSYLSLLFTTVCVCLLCLLVVRGGFQRKQPASVSAAGHSEDGQSDEVGPGKGHTGDDADIQNCNLQTLWLKFSC